MFNRRSRGQSRRPWGNPNRSSQGKKRLPNSSIDIRMLVSKVKDESALAPVPEHVLTHQFADFKMDPRIKENIRQKGYINPTPIQDLAIPHGLEGKDVIGLANTGTGKTAAFLIPLINKMLKDPRQGALILAPTRELAFQIQEELLKFTRGLNLHSVLCIGGESLYMQGKKLRNPHHFIIGTPGRIMDLMNRRWLNLKYFQNVVLDEADRMVDMGFIKDIKIILGELPRERQSMFFTATLERSVEELIRQFMKDPVKVSVKKRDTAASVEQDVIRVPRDKRAKEEILVNLIRQPEMDKVLVFVRTKHGVDKVCRALLDARIHAASIHGDKSQGQRMYSLKLFKKGEIQVLVATDVAARGLDIPAVSHVINFDLPSN